ncbi:MAG: DUF4349 domain-containing protein [Bacteroidota bacterium]|jgi:hypothetical protein|nr:DUF4349 domain-containing protein [Bacteroidota bacterium]
MKQMTKFLGVIILLAFFGCAQNRDSAMFEMADEAMVAPTTEQIINETDETVETTETAKTAETVERKLIKEGQVEFETDDLNSTRETIFEAVRKYKGYVSSDQEFKSPGRKSNIVIIRVPADNFDNLLSDATQGVKRFESKEINVKDVTEEFLDIQARLKTKKGLEQRFIDLLKVAKNVTEILEIEKQIGELRSDIESIEGRLKYLQDRVSFSTLTMTFYETIPHETAFGQKFKNALVNGWDNLIWLFVGLTHIWPFILIAVAIVIGIRAYRKRKK